MKNGYINNNLTVGTITILYTNTDGYIAKRNGYNDTGVVVYIKNLISGKKEGLKLTGLTH